MSRPALVRRGRPIVIPCRPLGVAHLLSHCAGTILDLVRRAVLEALARFCEWREQCIEEELEANLAAGVRMGPGYVANSINQARDYGDRAAAWRAMK